MAHSQNCCGTTLDKRTHNFGSLYRCSGFKSFQLNNFQIRGPPTWNHYHCLEKYIDFQTTGDIKVDALSIGRFSQGTFIAVITFGLYSLM